MEEMDKEKRGRDRQTSGQKGKTNRLTDRQTDSRIDREKERWIYRQKETEEKERLIYRKKDREKDKQIYRNKEGQRERQTDIVKYRGNDEHTDKRIEGRRENE